MPSPDFDNSRHGVPQHQIALGQVVLVHLLDVDRQGFVGLALDQADRGVLGHRPKDAAETAGGDGRPEPPYRLEGIIELDDAFVGGKRPGKRGRGADGKTAILVACEHNDGKPGFVAMKAVERVDQDNVKAFAQEAIAPGQTLHTDAFAALRVLAEGHDSRRQSDPA